MAKCDITERVETRALQLWHDAFVQARIPGYDWRIERVGDALCSVCASDPSILMNRVLEVGASAPPDKQALHDIRRVYDEAGVARFFLQVVPERKDSDTDQLLTATGYEKYRGWMKFKRGPGDVRAPNTDLEIRPVGPKLGADFAAIAAPAFDMLPVSQPVIALLPGVDQYHAFMSFDGDDPAGTGVIFIDKGTGLLDWGTTHPDYRRRGGQTAVLSARLEFAFNTGCAVVTTTTGEAVPGDPQHSYSNILKSGFSEAYLRENWVPAAR